MQNETPVQVLNGIREAMESRGYAHMANGRDIGRLLDEQFRLREALETIWQHSCQCSPEIAIDDEEKSCAVCIAGNAIGKLHTRSQMILSK